MSWRHAAIVCAVAAAALLVCRDAVLTAQPASGPAYFVRSLDNPRDRRESRGLVLDTPVLPGSVMKAVTLVAALEAGVITSDTAHLCRRVVTVDGQQYVCAHPDLKRPLSAAEALAHSCNDFFVSLAPRLSRAAVNSTRRAAGLPPLGNNAGLAAALVGLDGPRVTPRALVDVMARLVGAGKDAPVPMRATTKETLIEGLRGAATYGTAAALGGRGVSALAKTGTAPMPGGGVMGLVIVLSPAVAPTRAVVVVTPGGAGVDAATIAADLLTGTTPATTATRKPAPVAVPVAPAPRPVAMASTLPATIRLGRSLPNGRTRTEVIALDTYVSQVLAGEGQPRAGDAAQQALAIAARTFALANRNRHRREGFDLCDTTHCQVTRAATDTTRRAAAATTGRVLLHQGEPAFVFYSALCGGHSELASHVWPGALDYGQASRPDEACAGEPAWDSEIRVTDVERALRAAGLRGSKLRELRILQRNPSGRVVRLRADGFTPSDIDGHEFRMAIGRVGGWQLLKSTAFDVQRTGTGYRFRGRGFGHGVGLCVIGAGTRAARGASVDDILAFYFPGLTVSGVRGPMATTTAADPADAVVVPPAPISTPAASTPAAPTIDVTATDVALALPAEAEPERRVLLSIVRTARDEVAKATGVATPAQIRLTVHPTVESFGRATGQPWWVSGASDGRSIELLPLSALVAQGLLERTIRHEMTHVLLDGALAGRPMWVREGAALYYSNPATGRTTGPPPRPASARVTCPSDAELLRSASAGALRDAYARAEACFGRAVAAGKKWNEVR